jgi:hypothetical protein
MTGLKIGLFIAHTKKPTYTQLSKSLNACLTEFNRSFVNTCKNAITNREWDNLKKEALYWQQTLTALPDNFNLKNTIPHYTHY